MIRNSGDLSLRILRSPCSHVMLLPGPGTLSAIGDFPGRRARPRAVNSPWVFLRSYLLDDCPTLSANCSLLRRPWAALLRFFAGVFLLCSPDRWLNPLGTHSSRKIRRGLQGAQQGDLPIQLGPECPEKVMCLLRRACTFYETDKQRMQWFLRPSNPLFMLLIVSADFIPLVGLCVLYTVLYLIPMTTQHTGWFYYPHLAVVGSETQRI